MNKSKKNTKGQLIGTVVTGSTLQLLYSSPTGEGKDSSTHVISCKTNSEARALEALHRQTWGLAPVKHQPVGHICGQIYPIPESWKTMKIKNDLKARFGNQPAKELVESIGVCLHHFGERGDGLGRCEEESKHAADPVGRKRNAIVVGQALHTVNDLC